MLVDNENRVYITQKRAETSSLWFAVKHVVVNRFERNEFQKRGEVVNAQQEASTRSVIVRSITPPSPPSVPLQTTMQP